MKKLEEITANFLQMENIAALLKQIVIDGRLGPEQTVVEAHWAHEFDAAQASIREATNLLIAEGFLVKDSGRSARVVDYRKRDVAQIYDVRTALEGALLNLLVPSVWTCLRWMQLVTECRIVYQKAICPH